jgi:hypothetical protein
MSTSAVAKAMTNPSITNAARPKVERNHLVTFGLLSIISSNSPDTGSVSLRGQHGDKLSIAAPDESNAGN